MKINWAIFLIAMAYGLVETGHYGWNWHAKSDAEMICDGIALLIVASAFVGRREN